MDGGYIFWPNNSWVSDISLSGPADLAGSSRSAVELLIACEGGELIGFLDDNERPLGSNAGKYPPVLGRPRDFLAHSTEYTLLLGVADPLIPKMSLVRDIESRGGCVWYVRASSSAHYADIHELGRVVRNLQAGWRFWQTRGSVTLRSASTPFPELLTIASSAPARRSVLFVDICGRVAIGSEVFIGSHACLIPGVRVGDRARIGAGSIVMRNVNIAGGKRCMQSAARTLHDEI